MQFNNTSAVALKLYKASMRILPMLFWILLIFAFDNAAIAIMTLLCIIIHEGGHFLSGFIICGQAGASATLSGLRIKFDTVLSYKSELIIAASGPLSNLIASLLLIPFRYFLSGYLFLFLILNLFTAISNLAPISGYDGYRILFCLFSGRLGEERVFLVLEAVSFVFSAILCIFALFLMAFANTGYWLYFIFIAALLKGISRHSKSHF